MNFFVIVCIVLLGKYLAIYLSKTTNLTTNVTGGVLPYRLGFLLVLCLSNQENLKRVRRAHFL